MFERFFQNSAVFVQAGKACRWFRRVPGCPAGKSFYIFGSGLQADGVLYWFQNGKRKLWRNVETGGMAVRSAKESGNFPYRMSTVCYFEVDGQGAVKQIPHKNKSDRDSMRTAYERARAGSTKIYAVWPGNWSSDLFLIDDLDAFAEKWELV